MDLCPERESTTADKTLEHTDERFNLLVAAVRDYAIFMLDPHGFISTWNAGAERIKGYTEREIVGQHFSIFYTPEDAAAGKPQRLLERAVRFGSVEDETWRVRKDGSRFWANVVITALRDGTGELSGFAKVTRDLTERRKAEEERRRRLAAEEAARLRSEFLSVAAHELRTPLTSLRGYAQLALRRYERNGALPPEQMMQALRTIVDQAGKITRLIEQLLDVSRLEEGRLVLERRETDLAGLAGSVVEMFRARGDSDRLRLDVPREPVLASADPMRVEQILTNLIDNALKYSPRESPVKVSVTTADDDEAAGDGARDGEVRIAVEDQGPGVPPEDRQHLFDRFFRSRATNGASGFGIGLYVCREIVGLHGGEIRAEFPDGGGTRMVVTLPRRDAAAERDETARAAA